MSYRVLNSISVKNLSGKEFVKDKSSLLVVLVDKSAKKNKLLIHMDKVTKGSLFKSINSFLKSKAKSLNLQSPNGVSSKEVLLIKTPEKSNTYLWLDLFKSISKIAYSLGKQDISVMFACKCPDGKDESWLTEVCCRQIEASAYIFGSSKNKTVVKESIIDPSAPE